MTGQEIPAGELWLVTSPAGTRLVRARPGGVPFTVPDGGHAIPASDADGELFAAGAPAQLRAWWQLADAARPWFGFQLWKLPGPGQDDDRDPAGWLLAVHLPGGVVQRYEWTRSGTGYAPAAQTEIGTGDDH